MAPGEPAAQGDAERFAQLVRENKRAVFAVAQAKLRNSHDAEDVMQEVFVEAYRKFRKMRNPNGIGAWLYKATVYRCKDHFRKKSRRERRERIFTEIAPINPSTDAAPDSGIADAVLDAIELLPEKYRQLLMLKHFARLSYSEISKLTGLPQSKIGGRLQAARRKLREKLIEMGEGVDRK
jgi:RNA polymerase sigma-70 factor (ECF subfamily)